MNDPTHLIRCCGAQTHCIGLVAPGRNGGVEPEVEDGKGVGGHGVRVEWVIGDIVDAHGVDSVR